MAFWIPLFAVIGSAIANLAWLAFVLLTIRFIRQAPACAEESFQPPISLLLPMKGDTGTLHENLAALARLKYPAWELLAGAEDPHDPALAIAERVAAEVPGAPLRVLAGVTGRGTNPQSRTLQGLAAQARHDYWLLLDDAVRPNSELLRRISPRLSNPRTGLWYAPLIGVGEQSAGAAFENYTFLTLTTVLTVVAQVGARIPAVTGKFMLMRREAVTQIGGLACVRKFGADDQVLADRIREAGWEVELLPEPIPCVHAQWPVRFYFSRHFRWLLLRRRLSLTGFWLEPLASPLAVVLYLSAAAALYNPPLAAGLLVATAGLKTGIDAMALRVLRGQFPPLKYLLWIPVKDVVLYGMWLASLFRRRVSWRGATFYMLKGTRLVTPQVWQRARIRYGRKRLVEYAGR